MLLRRHRSGISGTHPPTQRYRHGPCKGRRSYGLETPDVSQGDPFIPGFRQLLPPVYLPLFGTRSTPSRPNQERCPVALGQ